ncbi:MAG: hypothetical protein Q8M23_06075 [Bacteroidales bacterium]|nr:hypothetical protein [Bacteroidales bacterium]
MKRKVLSGLLFLLMFNCFAQLKREVIINPMIDSSYTEFSEIFGFWQSYLNELNAQNFKNNFLMNSMPENLKDYWDQSEIENYLFPDLYYSFKRSYGNVFYPWEREYFIGIVKRNTNIFELKTVFVSPEEGVFKGFPSFLITVPIIISGDTYKLVNKFTLYKCKLESKVFSNITYYYSPHYEFNDSLANLLTKRIEDFKKNFQIEKQEPITYLVADNITEISTWFGIDYFQFDYLGGLSMIEGRALKTNNMILCGGCGNNYLHEIIHILLKDYERGKYMLFEEGVASFFGEHLNYNYNYHVVRLKEYLQKNKWINLSKSLSGYYRNFANEIMYEVTSNSSDFNYLTYSDAQMKTNFAYIIHSVLCDIALRQGGYAKVKELFLHKADNEQEFYHAIEKELGIKQADLDSYIQSFINENY